MRLRYTLLVLATAALLPGAAHLESELLLPDNLELVNTTAEKDTFKGKSGVKIAISAAAAARAAARRAGAKKGGKKGGPPNFAALEASRLEVLALPKIEEFSSGTIEVDLAGSPAPGATGGARGFIGVAFRVQADKKTYDAYYLRPTNGRADDQERRNHSAQYIHHPHAPWFKSRAETPSKYEAYVDIRPDEWIHVKITVDGEKSRLYINGNDQPTLVVNDLHSGADGKGAVALWLESSTVARYANLKVTHR